MYSFKQAAELAEIHENTARTYRDRFIEFFSYTGAGRRRQYAENTPELLRFIGERVAQGLSQEQIQAALEAEFGVFITTVPPEDNNSTREQNNLTTTSQELNTITPTQLTELVRLAVAKELQSRDDQIAELKAELQESRQVIETLIRERDAQIMEQIREIMATKKESWWKRLFRTK